MSRDTIYSSPQTAEPFQFDDRVTAVFADMIKRSVPGYGMIIDMTAIIARRYVQAGTRCYDLGSSLGASTLAMRHGIAQPDCSIIAIDNSPAMVDRCRELINVDTAIGGAEQKGSARIPVTVLCEDVCDVNYNNASLIAINFTLQFIAEDKRALLLKNLYDALVPGGALIVSEKIAFEDSGEQTLLTDLHHDFKGTQGYSALEIAQKRQAIENVLIADTVARHRQRLLQAGFSRVHVWFQCFNFCSMIAVK
jgi:tRNA (cmo5U34)-methyltransferase